jgi:hypothetical protein
MATIEQSKYIADLVVLKTKEFKEVKELLLSNEIITASAETVSQAASIDEITHALTDQQASKFIDVLVSTKEPARGSVYSKKRIEQASSLVEDIKKTIEGWGF